MYTVFITLQLCPEEFPKSKYHAFFKDSDFEIIFKDLVMVMDYGFLFYKNFLQSIEKVQSI